MAKVWVNRHYDEITALSEQETNYSYLEQLAGLPDYCSRDRKELYINFFNNYGISKESEAEETCIDHNPVRSRSTGGAE